MLIKQLDLGAEDARNLSLLSQDSVRVFLDSFVIPEALDIAHFFEGRKHFVYGDKGSGKTALLQYIRALAERDLNATTSFYYFQSTFSPSEMAKFRNTISSRSGEEIISDNAFAADEDGSIFWRVFLFNQIARSLKRIKIEGDAADRFFKAVEAIKVISTSQQSRRKYPSLESFQMELSRDPRFQVSGSFKEASPEDLRVYLEIAEDALEDVWLQGSPIYLFVDEMEIYKRNDKGDDVQASAISSLITTIRDFGERFSGTDIRVIAAIRQEIVSDIATVKYEIHRIVRDKGIELDWPKSVKSGFHPLERTILNRIAAQDPEIKSSSPISDAMLQQVIQKYFEGKYDGKQLLDKTWYRPRDMALIFEIAKTFDGSRERFRAKTLTTDCLPDLGTRLWQDAKSGLAAKYNSDELKGIDKLLRGGRQTYTRAQWLERMSVLRDQDDFVAQLADKDWEDLLKNLYSMGVIFYSAKTTNYKNFFFRGDAMPTFTEYFEIGVHRTLWNELSLT